MSRLSKEQLTVLMKKENVTRLWSWSKVNTFLTSKYEYFLKYIKHIQKIGQIVSMHHLAVFVILHLKSIIQIRLNMMI